VWKVPGNLTRDNRPLFIGWVGGYFRGPRIALKQHKCERPAWRESKTHGSNYSFLPVRCNRNCDHFHRLPLSVGPSTAAAAYGVPTGAEPHLRAYLSAKGIRDVASGLFAAILIAYGSAHVLGWFMLAATLIPIADAVIVLHQGVHAPTGRLNPRRTVPSIN
jgi:hypothetical protein